ncbi:hypothetical protein LINPERHAP2_LOCUS34296, partial [Linum perenne]
MFAKAPVHTSQMLRAVQNSSKLQTMSPPTSAMLLPLFRRFCWSMREELVSQLPCGETSQLFLTPLLLWLRMLRRRLYLLSAHCGFLLSMEFLL